MATNQTKKLLLTLSVTLGVSGAILVGGSALLFFGRNIPDPGSPGPAPKAFPKEVLDEWYEPLPNEILCNSGALPKYVVRADQTTTLTVMIDGISTEHGHWAGKNARLRVDDLVFSGTPERRQENWGPQLVDTTDQLIIPRFTTVIDGSRATLRTSLICRAEMSVIYPKKVGAARFDNKTENQAGQFFITFLPGDEFVWFKKHVAHKECNRGASQRQLGSPSFWASL